MPFDPRSLSLYPEEPGVYLMKNAAGRMLYIGKAKNLKTRLKQYFSEHDAREMIPLLISQVETIDTIVALTEKDALILENNLIKRHRPKYNILLKDDKTYVSLLITQHKWPMIQLVRNKGKPKDKGRLFGPYTNALAARQTYDLLMKLFPLRQCSNAELMSRKRPCLLYEMKKCIAPCVGKCTEDEYHRHVEAAARLLKGQDKEIVFELKAAMQRASEEMEFEQAEKYLQLIRQIEHVTTVQHVDNPAAKDCDSIGIHREADAILIALLQFREGKLIASEHSSFHMIVSSDEEAIEAFLLQHYKSIVLPPEILLPFDWADKQIVQEILSESAGKAISLLSPQKGKKKDLVEMARRNAKALFARELDERSLREKMLLDLQETLQLTRFPRRIVCFDTSHISGSDPVASLATFVNGERDKNRTRLFSIKSSPTSEDYASMREVLQRHFLKEKEKQDLSDLLIVDGGKGQLNIALAVFQQLDIASIDVIALTKDAARHDRGLTAEKIYLPHRKDPLMIDPRSPMLFLLQRIRDEAHRLAIGYHRKRRSKRTLKSELDDLPGIGPVKRRRLLGYYGSVRALKAASKESLSDVGGITKKDAEEIWNYFHESL